MKHWVVTSSLRRFLMEIPERFAMDQVQFTQYRDRIIVGDDSYCYLSRIEQLQGEYGVKIVYWRTHLTGQRLSEWKIFKLAELP